MASVVPAAMPLMPRLADRGRTQALQEAPLFLRAPHFPGVGETPKRLLLEDRRNRKWEGRQFLARFRSAGEL